MVYCIKIQNMSIPVQQCKSFEALIHIASKQFDCPIQNIKLYFNGSNNCQTQIQSDSDLLSLKYISRSKEYSFKVEISKSKQQIEQQLQNEAIEEYLFNTYEGIADSQVEKQLKKISKDYLNQLYSQIIRQEEQFMIKKIEEEEVKKYIAKINSCAINAQLLSKMPIIERRNKVRRVSPERSNFQRKESMIEKMVGRVLDEMMPLMVKQLSSRIMEELRESKKQDYRYDFFENPEEL